MEENHGSEYVIAVELDRIRPDREQPRRHFDEEALRHLADSIAAEGQQTPVILVPVEDDPIHHYQLVDGERRFRAAQMAGIPRLQARIRPFPNQDERFISAVIANFGREGHTPLETADAIARILEMPRYAIGTRSARIERVAKIFARSPAWIYQHLNLLELHPSVRAMLEPSAPEGERLSRSMAAFLHTIQDRELQLDIAREIAKKNLKLNPARRFARFAAEAAGARAGSRRRQKPSDAHRIFQNILVRLDESVETMFDLPKRGFLDALRKRTPDQRRMMLDKFDACIARLGELKEILERASGA